MTARRPSVLRRFVEEESGSVLTFWAVTFAAILGLLALSFDFGRLAATQSELQSFTDSVALAAAGELNGQSDAIERATAAAAELIQDSQTFGSGDTALGGADDFALAFYSSPPTADSPGVQTSDPAQAGFVQVISNTEDVTPIFGAAFSALTGQDEGVSDASSSSVAGYSQYACDITPLMFCAPSPSFRADANIGASVLLRAGGPNAAWGPGAFGFLDPSAGAIVDEDGVCGGLSGANLDICLIAAVGNRTGCFKQSGVEVAGGQRVGNFGSALNVLFDVYHATTNNLSNDPDYPPAPNVLSSWEPSKGQCIGGSPTLSETQMGLPPDDCHGTGSCDRFGDGNWSTGRAAYVAMNYGLTDPHPAATTRYEYYLAEVAAAQSGASTVPNGMLPQCSPHTSTDPQRRVLTAASIDCSSYDLKGGASDVPVLEFVEVFLAAPVGLDDGKDIWVEIIGSVGGGSGSTSQDARIREVVQLFQ